MEAAELMKKRCCPKHLMMISKRITDWKYLAIQLGFSLEKVDELDKSQDSLPLKKIAMLLKWKEKLQGQATYSMLADAFGSIKRNDLVEEVKEMLFTPCGEEEWKQLADNLRKKYKDPKEAVRFSFMRIPVPRQFFRLVLVKDEGINKPEDKARVLSMMGGMDTVAKKKIPINLKDIFTEAGGSEGKLILIEGAPGSGKSTLLWHICQKWGSGELFQEFNLVVHIQLRNPDIHSVKSFVDLLPCSTEVAKTILDELQEVEGKRVMFLLDGWDELPPSVQVESFIHDLLNRTPKSPLCQSSIIVSSRHMPSDDYYMLLTSNLEIVGFTEIEVK